MTSRPCCKIVKTSRIQIYITNTEIFKVVKNENFQWKMFAIFLIFAQNIDCGYNCGPRRGGSNEYPQSMFWSKI